MRTARALRRLNGRMEIEAARVAAVLHDEAGQLLVSNGLALTDLIERAPPSMRDELQAIRETTAQIGAQLRRLSHGLRPGVLEALGLAEAIKFIADACARRMGLQLTVDVALAPGCAADVEAGIFRFVQEGLNNVCRHARARTLTIVLWREGSSLRCSIEDDGDGFEGPVEIAQAVSGGIGLTIIQDRLAALGGTLRILSSPGRGTQLHAMIPEPR
jgi:signal transduction histidine kinase